MPRMQLSRQYTPGQIKAMFGKAKANKFGAKKTKVDGITFDSKKEASYYMALKLRCRAGEIRYFHRQVRFDLPGNTKYTVDFQEFHADGSVHYVDVKGHQTKEFVRAKKQVEALYPIEIELA